MVERWSESKDLLAGWRKIRKRFPRQAQKDAADFLQAVRVDGQPPDTVSQLDAALEQLEAEVAAIQLVDKWGYAGVEVPAGPLGGWCFS